MTGAWPGAGYVDKGVEEHALAAVQNWLPKQLPAGLNFNGPP
jgi:hypothetical protein